MFHVLWNRTLGECLKIEQTSVAPPFRVTCLDAEFALHFVEALGIDVGLHGVPDSEEMACLADTVIVLVAEFVPESAAALHLEVPRHVVEPCQQVFRTGVDIVVETAELVGILFDIGGTLQRAVESQSDAVGLVIVRRGPVGSHAAWLIPRFGAVMVISGKDVM